MFLWSSPYLALVVVLSTFPLHSLIISHKTESVGMVFHVLVSACHYRQLNMQLNISDKVISKAVIAYEEVWTSVTKKLYKYLFCTQ